MQQLLGQHSLRERFREWCLARVSSETATICSVQQYFGVPHNSRVGNFWYYFFTAASVLGHEVFFASIFPVVFYVFDFELARRCCAFWAFTLFLGQSLKDMLRLPRPQTPPVFRLEHSHLQEYGFPSTHAMTSLVLSGYTAYYLYTNYTNFSLVMALSVFIVWTTSVCLSRIYLGVHSPIDLVGGCVIGAGLLFVFTVFSNTIARVLSGAPEVPILLPAMCILMLYLFPRESKQWSSSFGDATRCLSSACGALLGSYSLHPAFVGVVAFRAITVPFSIGFWFSAICRVLIGLILLVITKEVVRAVANLFVPAVIQLLRIAPAYEKGVPNNRRYVTEIPILAITYFTFSFVAIGIAPRLFPTLGL
jgi:membrane-associated phospholipid phosphatase